MKVAFIGAGAAGSVFACYLKLGGADITLVDPNKEHMDKVAKDGMIFSREGAEDVHVDGFKTSTSAEGIGKMDIVVFMTKTYQLRSAIQGALCCCHENTVAVSLINGLGNDDIMLEFFPPERCIYGSGAIATMLLAPGHCKGFPPKGSMINYGPVKKSELADAAGKFLHDTFALGGCPTHYTYDIATLVWKKAIHNSAVNTVSAVVRMPQGCVEDDEFGRQIYRQVLNEGIAVAKAKSGVDIDLDEFLNGFFLPVISTGHDYFPSMCQDMFMNMRKTEIDALNGAIARYGKELGIPTPTNALLTQLVSCMHGNYDKQYKG